METDPKNGEQPPGAGRSCGRNTRRRQEVENLENLLQIDIISDIVCPWCIISFKQLEQAIEETDRRVCGDRVASLRAQYRYATRGENLRAHIMRKYGVSAEHSQDTRERLAQLGAGLGFDFRFTDDMQMVNTFKTHQVLHWAGPEGKEHPLKTGLFEVYYTDGKDVSDTDTLASIAASVGLNRQEAVRILQDGRFANVVREEEGFWRQDGIEHVPAVIFERRHIGVSAVASGNLPDDAVAFPTEALIGKAIVAARTEAARLALGVYGDHVWMLFNHPAGWCGCWRDEHDPQSRLTKHLNGMSIFPVRY